MMNIYKYMSTLESNAKAKGIKNVWLDFSEDHNWFKINIDDYSIKGTWDSCFSNFIECIEKANNYINNICIN